ncbi:uncharacterized protein HD556DRAFT_323944 [Suillus plorans]|uniref:Uncharacterized protein n=1 Tax=Suillus plorans TaxID=116603 RepID=A0A9P7J7I2_9AGAM|nr:uncharacterized protein HD556DRAFT_323944 [Suillus plorans]KAG1806573.1 hypothetical protein HD556DRAFT_323944 [Suillus plorans]
MHKQRCLHHTDLRAIFTIGPPGIHSGLGAACEFQHFRCSEPEYERFTSLSSPETSTTFQPLSRTNDMTGGPEAKPIESVPEQLFVDSHIVLEEDLETGGSHSSVCSCFICEEDREYDTLLDLRLDGRNIVLDSLYPDIAPHIVITPPVSCADDFYTPYQNRVDPQWPCFLNVPRLSPRMYYHHRPLPSSHDESAGCNSKEFHSQSVAPSDHLGLIRPKTPPRVFSRKKLNLAVEASSIERLVFRKIVDGIFRHRRKAVAFEASLSASAVCTRFNESVASSLLERPFVWTDPAQPILLASRNFSGISIIESDCAFRAPHIIIIAAEPHDPWISWGNRVDDQDYDYLTVYPKGSSTPPINSTSLATVSVPGPHHQDDPDNSGLPSDHSRECHLVTIPPSLDEYGCFLTPHEKGRTTYTDHPHFTPDVNEFTDSEKMSLGLSIIRCETPTPDSDDEDEDDLPPFDDWYLSVIERSKSIGA